MKFSYKLIKKYLPEVKSKESLVNSLNMRAFETEIKEGDTFDVSVPSNRYSNVARHIGVAREAAAAMNLREIEIPKITVEEWKGGAEEFSLEVEDKKLCPRYTAWYFDGVKISSSPDWMQKVLSDCGVRPINNVVDIMNYVMLETGQPLHAFDYDKIEGRKILVRKAKKGETITSIEGVDYNLNPSVLVIADEKRPLAIAGIKGGKDAEITEHTRRIVVESANFDAVSIYNTSKNINLLTDASLRFAHSIHKRLALVGLQRVGELLQEIAGANPGGKVNSSPEIEHPRKITFKPENFNALMGTEFEKKEIMGVLTKLGFEIDGEKIIVPVLRDDVQIEEDLIEEAGRIFGFDDIKPKAPIVSIKPSESDNIFSFRSGIRKIMVGLGYDEVYNYSFVGNKKYGKVKIQNPISEEKSFLRATLAPLLLKNIENNLKYYNEVRIFEVGKVFGGAEERDAIGIAFGSRKEETFFEIKGVTEAFLQGLGLTDFYMVETEGDETELIVKTNSSEVGRIARYGEGFTIAELNADILIKFVEEEVSFRPLPKFPAVLRDISVLINEDIKIGNVIQEIQNVDTDLIEDVDLIDEYFGAEDGKQSITLRIRFRAQDRTLSVEDVDGKMNKIQSLIKNEFRGQVR